MISRVPFSSPGASRGRSVRSLLARRLLASALLAGALLLGAFLVLPGDAPPWRVAADDEPRTEENSSSRAVTILYTIHNFGYIEPCG